MRKVPPSAYESIDTTDPLSPVLSGVKVTKYMEGPHTVAVVYAAPTAEQGEYWPTGGWRTSTPEGRRGFWIRP